MPRRSRYIYRFPDLLLVVVALAALVFLQLDTPNVQQFRPVLIVGAVLLLIFSVGTFLFLSWRKIQAQRAWKMADIDNLSGFAFEKYLADLLRSQGYSHVEVTVQQGDFGADLLATKNGQRFAIQAKRYNWLVGIDAVYQCLGGQQYYKCDRSMVITNSHFTPAAQQLAQKSNTVLINRDKLQEWVSERQKKQ